MRTHSINFCYLIRRNKYFLIGCMIGIALSSISVPIKNCYDPSSTSTDNEEDILRIDNEQIVQKLVDWYQTVLHEKYEPIILNGTSDESFRPKQVTQFDQNGYNRNLILVRDNKLKFYRPRFHYSELNIKSRFLLCSFLNERRFPQSYENQKSFPGDLINNYINYTNDKIVNNQDLDVIYFYSEMYADNVRISSETTNLNLIDHNGNRLDRIMIEPNQSKHDAAINYLIEKNKLHDYSFVFMFTDQTLFSIKHLYELVNLVTISKNLVSFCNDKRLEQKNQSWKRMLEDIDVNESFLDCGLLISSALLIKCRLEPNCIRNQSNIYNIHPSYHMKSFHLPLDEMLTGIDLKWKLQIVNSLTIYPIPFNSETFHLINTLMEYKHLLSYKKNLFQNENEIESIKSTINDRWTMVSKQGWCTWPTGTFNLQKPHNRYEVSRWSYWNQSHVFMPNDIHVVRRLNQDELNEIANLKHYSEKWLSSESNLFIERIYRRFDAIRGLEYIIDAEHHKGTYSENIRLQLMKPLNPIELVADVAYVTENLRLTLILPVRGRMEVPLAIKFLNEYANLCLRRNNHQTILVIVLIYTHNSNKEDSSQMLLEDESKEFSRLKKVSLYIQSKYSTNSVNIAFMDLHPPKSSSFDHHNKRRNGRLLRYPSEMVYLDLIARSLRASSNEPFLMLHCRTNMLFSIDFLNRVRLNTIAKRQIFLPIPFVEYHLRSSESNSHFREILRNGISNNNVTASIVNLTNRSNNRNFDVRKENGFFDESNFEVVSFYLSDYLLARKFSEAEIPFVRNRQTIVKFQDAYYNSNLDLNHMFALYKKSSPTIGLMRAVEPELRLFHSTTLDDCQYFESNIMSFNNCKRRQHYGIGQKQKLALIVMEYLNM